MKNILEKLSSYKIFNYLLPGAVFAFWLTKFQGISLITENFFVGAFIYYFLGMIVSRFGSLIIEPFLIWIKFIKLEKYERFVRAATMDEKIEVLSEENNTYRAFISLFLVISFLEGYSILEEKFTNLAFFKNELFLSLLLLLLFILSFKKQTNYIAKRVKTTLGE